MNNSSKVQPYCEILTSLERFFKATKPLKWAVAFWSEWLRPKIRQPIFQKKVWWIWLNLICFSDFKLQSLCSSPLFTLVQIKFKSSQTTQGKPRPRFNVSQDCLKATVPYFTVNVHTVCVCVCNRN